MATIEVNLTIKVDGQPVLGSPIVKTLTISELEQLAVNRAVAGGYLATGDDLATISFFFLRADQSLGVKLNGGANVDCTLNANGILMMIDGVIAATAVTNILTSNLGSVSAKVEALVA